MKILLASVLIVSLSACSILAPPKYSETEYRTLADIATTIELGTCDKKTTDKLREQTTFLRNYTKHNFLNKDTYEAVVLIDGMVVDLYTRVEQGKQISETFCSRKLEILLSSVDSLKEASGGKLK